MTLQMRNKCICGCGESYMKLPGIHLLEKYKKKNLSAQNSSQHCLAVENALRDKIHYFFNQRPEWHFDLLLGISQLTLFVQLSSENALVRVLDCVRKMFLFIRISGG